MGIGKVLHCLLAKLVLCKEGAQATEACSNLNLCAGLEASIEGAIHAVCQRAERPREKVAQTTNTTTSGEGGEGEREEMSEEG